MNNHTVPAAITVACLFALGCAEPSTLQPPPATPTPSPTSAPETPTPSPTPAPSPGPSATPAELVVVARLVDRGPNAAGCGILHLAVEMTYEVIRIERGTHTGASLHVAHGCPEMSRRMYGGANAGTLTTFTVGATHRLELTTTPPTGVSIMRTGPVVTPVYWATRADAVP